MDALGVIDGQGSIHHEPRDGILVIDDIIVLGSGGVDGGESGTGFVDLVVFTVIGVGADGGKEGVAKGVLFSEGNWLRSWRRVLTVDPNWLGRQHLR